MERIRLRLEKAAALDIPVLFTGETGVGKEHTADLVQSRSRRKDRPFVKVNCVGFTDSMIDSELFGHVRGAFTGALENRIGLLESAHNGTLFLDEIGDMPLDVQAKLLRFLQDKEVRPVGSNQTRKIDVRLMFATRRDLWREVEAGRFRDDLYFRIAEFPIHIPPLRERKDEIIPLAESFLASALREFGVPTPKQFCADRAGELRHSQWPGNVRELRAFVRRFALDY